MENHAATQGGQGRRNCGISVEQGGLVMRVLSGKTAEALVRKLEQRGSAGLGRVEKQVRRIVEDVRKNGDKALRRYAQKWDGVGPEDPLRVSTAELKQAWRSVSQEFRNALQTAAANIRSYCERQR